MPTESPTRGFALSDFDGPNQPADNVPPENNGQQAAAPEVAPALVTNEPEAPEVEEPEKPQTTPTPEAEGGAKSEEDDGPISIGDAMDRQAAKTKAADDERKAAEKAKVDEPEKKTDETAKDATKERDSDLEKIQLAPQAHERTRKVLNEVKAHARTARDERDMVAKERDELRTQLATANEKAKTTEAPKELVEELKAMRERVRELDITKDPEIATKYDAPIGENSKAIGEILKTEGLGEQVVADIIAKGANSNSIYRYVASIRNYAAKNAAKAEAEGTEAKDRPALMAEAERAQKQADDLLHLARENDNIGKQKQKEIDQWKSGYDQRVKQREAQTKQQGEERQKTIARHRDEVLNRDIESLAKDLPFLREPAAPQPNDPPAVQKAKQAAIADYKAAEARIGTELAKLKIDGAPPEKRDEIAGSLSAHAVQAVILKAHGIPTLLKQLNAANARTKELETELGKIRGAGKLSRAQGSSDSTLPNRGMPEPSNLDEAFDQAAGINR